MTQKSLQEALRRERRTNKRLRAVIDEVRAQVRQNRRDLDLQFARIAQLQAEMDLLKRAPSKHP
jgi:hypothetical protein